MHRSAIISVVSLLPISAAAFARPKQRKVEFLDQHYAIVVDCNRPCQ